LATLLCTTDNARRLNLGQNLGDNLTHLKRKLPGWADDESEGTVKGARIEKPRKHRKYERERLSASRLRLHYRIVPLKHHWNGSALDRRWSSNIEIVETLTNLSVSN
jgi:hypothetical protein